MNTELSKMTTTNGLEEVIIKLFKMTPQFKNLMTEMKTSIENKVNVSNRSIACNMCMNLNLLINIETRPRFYKEKGNKTTQEKCMCNIYKHFYGII